ncbi:hypothetical protein C9374_005126 [Naegleria lovaniensis]|uniref:Conserved oligomeric Golgi complex subunit 5 n=1 Tax=Naegleria lovaniensis TaxID=51637 RepID=A0AA88GKB6_NAELO|nr:uncharacterized protein C9374_005126 [Naegleria lovaniensis]KAG2382546.1 hypothetical protein C9374_005126 [Naegleria lovaniensis]
MIPSSHGSGHPSSGSSINGQASKTHLLKQQSSSQVKNIPSSEEMNQIQKYFKEDPYLKLFVENQGSSEALSFDVSNYLKNKLKEEDDQTSVKSHGLLDSEISKLQEGISVIDNQIFNIFEKQSSQLEDDELEFKNFLSKTFGDELKNTEETDMSLVYQYQNTISGKGFYKSIFEVQKLEDDLIQVKKNVETLQHSVSKLQSSLGSSYTNLNTRYKQLYNIFETIELLRKVYTFLSLVSKLRKSYNGYSSEQTNLFNVSQYIYDLEQIIKSKELEKITLVEKEVPYVKEVSIEVKNEAMKSIKEGMKNKQQSFVATGLQVFFNFGILSETVSEIVEHQLHTAVSGIKSTLNQKITKTNEGFKTQYLVQLKSMLFDLETNFAQVHHLDMVVKKKRDTLTQIEFSSILRECGNDNFLESFWKSIAEAFEETIKRTLNSNNQIIKDILLNEYPQFKSMMKEFSNSISNYLPILTQQELRPQIWMTSVLDSLETHYLSQCLNRLLDRTKQVFSKVVLPKPKTDSGTFKGLSSSDIRNLTSVIQQELSNVKTDVKLFIDVGKNVGKALRLFSNKSEEMMITDTSAKDIDLLSVLEGTSLNTIAKTPSPAQMFNANLFTSIYLLLSSTRKVIKTFSNVNGFAQLDLYLEPSLKKLDEIGKQILQPVFDIIKKQLLTVLLNMHLSEGEQYQKQQQLEMSHLEMGGEYNSNSLFVKQFFFCVKCAKRVYLSIYDTQQPQQNIFLPLIEQLYLYITVELTLKVITLSVAYPLEEREGHFLSVLNDAKQLQLMIGDFFADDTNYQTNGHLLFRAFLKTLFQSDYQSVEKHLATNNLSYIVLMIHLLFTKVENSEWIVPPHEHMNISLREYSKWWLEMNQKNDKAVLNVLSKCLEEMKQKDKESKSKAIPFIEQVIQHQLSEEGQ